MRVALLAYSSAAMVGQMVFFSRARGMNLAPEKVAAIALATAIGALLGARLSYLIECSLVLGTSANWLSLPFHGTTSYGSYFGGVLFLALASRVVKLEPLSVTDIGMSCLGIVVALGRLACFLDGDDFGRPSTGLLTVTFPPGTPAYVEQVRQGLISPLASRSLPVHPVQLYLSASGLLLFLLTSRTWTHWRSHPGLTTCAYWAIESPFRFLLEYLRGDQVHLGPVGLTIPQLLSVFALLMALAGLYAVLKRDSIWIMRAK